MKHGFTILLLILTPALAQAQLGAGPQVSYEAVTQAAPSGDALRAVVKVQLEEGWHVNANKPLDEFLIPTELTFDDTEGVEIGRAIYPKHKLFSFAHSEEQLAVYEHEFLIGIELTIDPSAAPRELAGKLRYQACDDARCMPPKRIDVVIPLEVTDAAGQAALFAGVDWNAGDSEAAPASESANETAATAASGTGAWRVLAEDFTVAARLDGFAKTDGFLAFLDQAETGAGPARNALAGKAWWIVVLLVLGGGFLLNLTPCVLPLIPINIAIIGAGARAGSRARGFALGAAYGFGISMVYGLLGLVVVLGLATTFGAINSTIWFNAGIAVLFFVLGLAMFDLIQIDFSKYQAKVGIRKNENGSFVIALVMGAIAALLAGACVAPVVIYTIIYAQDLYAGGVTIALALPFLLGVGMALPWPFAGAGLSFLPKPGMWMTRVKQAFGVFIIAFALYYAHLAYGIYENRNADPDAVRESVATEGWRHDLGDALAEAKEEGKPVLVDFWATWCKNCLVMNKTTLQDPQVLDRLDAYIRVKVQAEDLENSEEARHYEVLGLPTFVVLHPADTGP